MHRWLAIAAIALPLGCEHQSHHSQTVRVGEPYEAVIAILESDARDITKAVGIQRSRNDRYFILHDNTCLHVWSSRDEAGTERVASLTLGEAGRGYVDKFKWLAQTRSEVSELTLP